MAHYWQEIGALTLRWVRRLSREKFSMLFTLVQPMLFWLIFFGNLFQRAADVQVTQAPNYISFLAAGVVVMTVLNNGLAGGVDLLFDKENGFLERLMSAPIHRSSVILSRFIFVMTITSLQVLVILGIAFLFGVHPATGLLGVATILLIGMLFGVGLTAISMAMAEPISWSLAVRRTTYSSPMETGRSPCLPMPLAMVGILATRFSIS
mgnify:CR=1 FL=1